MAKATVCENCKSWYETGGTDEGLVGECRHNSPTPNHKHQISNKYQIPITNDPKALA
jgi:hypothetical protein